MIANTRLRDLMLCNTSLGSIFAGAVKHLVWSQGDPRPDWVVNSQRAEIASALHKAVRRQDSARAREFIEHIEARKAAIATAQIDPLERSMA